MGNNAPNYTVNNDIRLHWDFESSLDNENSVALSNMPPVSLYGRSDTSCILKESAGSTLFRTNTTDVSPPASSFSTVVWFSTHDDQKNSGCYSLTKYDHGQTNSVDNTKASFRSTVDQYFEEWDTGPDAVKVRYKIDYVEDGGPLDTPVLEQYVEGSKWNMYYAGVNGTLIEASVNGMAKVSGYIGLPFNSSGNYLFDYYEGIIDEVRTYDRTLTQDELSYLYNWGFPQPIDKEKPKRQYLYPSKTIGDPNIASGHYIIPNTDTFWTNLVSRTETPGDYIQYYHDELKRCTPSQNALPYSSTFSPINVWHTPYAEKTPEDKEAITMNEGSGLFRFETGPFFVEPSAITLHFKGASMPRRDDGINPTQEQQAHNGAIPEKRGHIGSIRLTDASGTDIINVPATDGIILEYSGDYGGESYVHHTSSVPLNSLVGLDLSTTYLHFALSTNGTYSTQGQLGTNVAPGNRTPYPVLFGAAVELNGAQNIANTGVGVEAYIDLYTGGSEALNSGIDLYTTAADFENSGIDLYSYGRAVETSSIPMYAHGDLTVNSGVDLYTSGAPNLYNKEIELYAHSALTFNSGVDLYTSGVPSLYNKEIELYTHGAMLHNSGIDLFLAAHDSLTFNNPLFIHGFTTDNSGIDLYVRSHASINSGIDLWTEGVELANGAIPFFAEATVSYGSGSFPLYMNSTTNTSVYKAHPMYLEVNSQETDTGGIPFFLNSITTGDDTGYMPFYLESKADSLTKGTDMYLQNAFESGYKSQFLYVKGLGTLDGGAVDNESMPLFIERIEGVEGGMSLYLGVNSGDEQGVNMYTFGGTWSNSGVDLVIPSIVGVGNSGINVYINGL